jgi:uncharacterized membrane protein (DUF106 family)
MLENLGLWVLQAADWIFGWILFLPHDLALFSVALLTSASLTLVRKWTTDQDWLHRAADDAVRLAHLRRDAKARGDTAAARRHKDILALIKLKALRFEGKPLLWALIPVALLATWAFSRLAYVPARLGEPVAVRACVSRSDIGKAIHLVPDPGIEVANGWVRTVEEAPPTVVSGVWDRAGAWVGDRLRRLLGVPPTPEKLDGAAIWKITVHDTQPRELKIRFAGRTYAAPFVAGTRHYENPEVLFADAPLHAIRVGLTPLRLFGVVGGIEWLALPPWLTAYMLIAIPFVTILRRLRRVA